MKKIMVFVALLLLTACLSSSPEDAALQTSTPMVVLSTRPAPTITSKPNPEPTITIELTPLPEYWEYVRPEARWDYTFEELAPHLDTPEKMLLFLQNNTTRRRQWDIDRYQVQDYWQLPETLHEEGNDDGEAMSRYAVCGLDILPNWHGSVLLYHYADSDQYTHGVGLLEEVETGSFYIFDSNQSLYGPYETKLEAVNAYRVLFKFDGIVENVDICPVEKELEGYDGILPYITESFEP